MAWGEERIAFLEVDQPLCSLTYSEAPCQAVLGVTGTAKCHNSRFTCQDPVNYTPGTLTLRFARDQLDILQYGNVIPGLRGEPRTTPMSINLGGMEESVSAFGKRETVTLVLDDHKYDDHQVDKYRLERSFLPAPRESGRYARYRPRMFRGSTERIARAGFFGAHDIALHPYNRGTFWGKWLARNPYHSGYPARIRMGTITNERVLVPAQTIIENSGTAGAGSANTLTLNDAASGTLNAYKGMLLRLPTGPGSVQERPVSAYDGGTKVATVSPAWGPEYLSLPGTAGNFASTLDSAAVSVTGDIDIRMKVALDNWAPTGGNTNSLLAKSGSSSTRSYRFDVTAGGSIGKLGLFTSPDGTAGAEVVGSSSVATGFAAGSIHWVRVTLDVNDGAGNRVYTFYTSEDGSSWTQLGAIVTSAGTTSIFDSADAVEVGSIFGGTLFFTAGKVFYAELRNGIDGPVVAKFDPDNDAQVPETSFTSSTGEVWTINQSGSPTAKLAEGRPDATTGYEVINNKAAYFDLPSPAQLLSDMRVRHYVVDRIEGPANGQVRVILKDLFSLVEAKKAVAPFASLGELSANLTGLPATFSVSPAGIGNLTEAQGGYASITAVSGHVAIGDEIIQVTRSGNTFTVVTRGALGTTAEDHAAEDLVQLVLSEVAQLAHNIIYRLLTVHGGIPLAQIDKPLWDLRAQGLTELYTGRVTTPTPVNQLVGELMLQAGCTVWPDTATGMIDFVALQAGTVSPTVNDEAWIAEGGALSIKRQDDKRVSQVHVYYGQVNPTEDLDDKRNFRSRSVTVDLAAEGAQQYGTPVIREIFSRWIPQFGRQSAERAGERLIAMFRDAPHEATIPLHASRDGQLNLARYFSLETAEIQDALGAVRAVTMAPVEIDRGETAIEVRAQQVTFETLEVAGERVITIENDSFNLNLRSIHDSLFSAPTGSEIVIFKVLSDVTVGSTSTTVPAVTTGSWPAMTTKPKIEIQAGARVQGKGGAGGNGGTAGSGNGQPGAVGGLAFLAESEFTVTGAGEIFGGGGAGGGGAGGVSVGGCGGGGGSGTDGGSGGAGGSGQQNGAPGEPGTADAGGDTGSACISVGGGSGGDPGLSGSAGTNFSGRLGGAGGAAGAAIDGVSLVTFDSPNLLDIRGAQT